MVLQFLLVGSKKKNRLCIFGFGLIFQHYYAASFLSTLRLLFLRIKPSSNSLASNPFNGAHLKAVGLLKSGFGARSKKSELWGYLCSLALNFEISIFSRKWLGDESRKRFATGRWRVFFSVCKDFLIPLMWFVFHCLSSPRYDGPCHLLRTLRHGRPLAKKTSWSRSRKRCRSTAAKKETSLKPL